MRDVQNQADARGIAIQRVGIKDAHLPFLIKTKDGGFQQVLARILFTVALPMEYKGTHMSRFVQALANWTEDLDYAGMKRLLEDVRERLNARRAHIVFHFPYFVQKNAPATACPGILPYECRLTGELPEDGKPSFLL